MNNEASHRQTIERVRSFIYATRRRLNRHRLWNTIFASLLVCGLAMLLVALIYVIQGFQVPWIAFGIIGGIGVVGGIGVWIGRRAGLDQAARYADQFFGLKDSVQSCAEFADSQKEGDFYSLQAQKTQESIDQASIDEIRYAPPYRMACLALLLILISIALGFKGPSEAVVERERQQQATAEMTATVNREIENLIDELEKSIEDGDERELLNPDKLREWVDELKETRDHKEALRQYAKLERKLFKASLALEQRRDEQTLDLAAEKLKKDEANRKLGDMLKQKKYEKASEELKKFESEELNPREMKKLSEQRKKLAKLKAAAKQMADASRDMKKNQRGKRQKAQNPTQGNRNNAQRAQGQANQNQRNNQKAGVGDPDGDELDRILEDLEEHVEELEEMMEEFEMEENPDEQDLEDCQDCQRAVDRDLDRLAKKLKRLAKQRQARAKLKRLAQQCAECQNGVAQGRSPNPGGKKAGKGTSDFENDKKDDEKSRGWYSKLKGIKGEGPSITKVEDAEDGTGVSGRTHEARQREFKRQFESFVEREDIPEDLKNGVKNYFNSIHENESESSGSGSDDAAGDDK